MYAQAGTGEGNDNGMAYSHGSTQWSINSTSGNGRRGFSSQHTGGAQFVMFDGAVRFISENIDSGNQGAVESITGPSPYGVWGALGTMAGGEIIGEF